VLEIVDRIGQVRLRGEAESRDQTLEPVLAPGRIAHEQSYGSDPAHLETSSAHVRLDGSPHVCGQRDAMGLQAAHPGIEAPVAQILLAGDLRQRQLVEEVRLLSTLAAPMGRGRVRRIFLLTPDDAQISILAVSDASAPDLILALLTRWGRQENQFKHGQLAGR
jgi:hypothetical protein